MDERNERRTNMTMPKYNRYTLWLRWLSEERSLQVWQPYITVENNHHPHENPISFLMNFIKEKQKSWTWLERGKTWMILPGSARNNCPKRGLVDR